MLALWLESSLPGELLEGIVGCKILGKEWAVWRMALNVTIVLTEGLRWPLSKCPQDLLLGPLDLWSWAQRRAPVCIKLVVDLSVSN